MRVFVVIALLSLGVIVYAFLLVNEGQMRVKEELDRSRVLKTKAHAGRQGGALQLERDLDDLSKGRAIM
jgi:hypothetical protein